ncbi:alpha 1,2-mannosyltransferase [Nematocida sp. AWRm79]|nr:alpha 1,2-mannosyltransferase [Nematocida sp. AWRm79]
MYVWGILYALCLVVKETVQKESACIFILCRNSDISGLKPTITKFEKYFNKKYQYPYVLVNDVPFTEDFKKEFTSLTGNPVEFGIIPTEHWSYPVWIDKKKAKERRDIMQKDNVLYGGSESYRHMCRYFSGFFFNHPLTAKYQYYWRVEPDTALHCPIEYDVFEYMRTNKKKYGFTITLYEYPQTVTSLWKTVQQFISSYNTFYRPGDYWTIIEPINLHRFITDEMYTRYNMCHFWSNFEIADFSFFRSKKYKMFFNYLDRSGGFFYERWGDAPVHSIAASIFLNSKEVHYFEDIGYTHPPFTHCPHPSLQKSACDCNASTSVSITMPQCISLYKKVSKLTSNQ